MALKIQNLNKRFDEKIIFDNFSYEFLDTGLYVIEGKSGIGKTTLLRIIAGLDIDYTGTVTDGGLRNVSIAFQEHRLFNELTALENVTCVINNANVDTLNDVKALLKKLGFNEDELYLRPDELSGGMQQRISLARALCKNAPLLLLDEPLKELDAGLVATVLKLIENESRTRTVIMVSHLDIRPYCTNAIYISL